MCEFDVQQFNWVFTSQLIWWLMFPNCQNTPLLWRHKGVIRWLLGNAGSTTDVFYRVTTRVLIVNVRLIGRLQCNAWNPSWVVILPTNLLNQVSVFVCFWHSNTAAQCKKGNNQMRGSLYHAEECSKIRHTGLSHFHERMVQSVNISGKTRFRGLPVLPCGLFLYTGYIYSVFLQIHWDLHTTRLEPSSKNGPLGPLCMSRPTYNMCYCFVSIQPRQD
jgi:hypothetical protein